MASFDLWFSRIEDGGIAWTVAKPGEPPVEFPSLADSVSDVYRLMRVGGHTVAQVGIF